MKMFHDFIFIIFFCTGPAENQGFHVNAGGAYPGQGAGGPANAPASQPPIRQLQMHPGATLPPPSQQPPHPQPPPTPTSTPPASDMGKQAQIPQSKFIAFSYDAVIFFY